MSKLSKNSKRILGVAAACLMLAGWSASSHAQVDCSLERWTVGAGGLTSGENTGSRADGFSRYAGPCSLRIPVTGSPSYLETPVDGSPSGRYIARFYVNRASAGNGDTLIFAGRDGTGAGAENLVQIHYNDPSPGDFTLYAFDGGVAQDSIFISANEYNNTPWVSVEFDWEASSATGNIAFVVNGFERTGSLDTSGLNIVAGFLGNVLGADGGAGSKLYFDDFDSRRSTRPGRLCRGLTDPDRPPASDGWQRIGSADRQAIFVELATGGNIPAGGQPDFLEDGNVGSPDRQAIFVAIATGNNSCENLQ